MRPMGTFNRSCTAARKVGEGCCSPLMIRFVVARLIPSLLLSCWLPLMPFAAIAPRRVSILSRSLGVPVLVMAQSCTTVGSLSSTNGSNVHCVSPDLLPDLLALGSKVSHNLFMDIIEYLQEEHQVLSTLTDLAPILGVSYATVKRVGKDGFSSEQIIKIARHYEVNPVDALVAVGRLTSQEVARAGAVGMLEQFSDVELLEEVLNRALREESIVNAPLDDSHPNVVKLFGGAEMSDLPDIKAAKRKDGRRASVEGAEGSTP